MSILNRPDGMQFVTQAYRERLPVGKRSLLVQRIRQLAEQHGHYVLIYPLRSEVLEVVFSRELGYLVGETVWHYFDRPAYLIFCERLSKENNQVLLVVVRNNEVYLDTVVENDKLRGELLPLMAMQESFRVVTCGEVSLSQQDTPNSFALPKNLVASFEVAQAPIFRNLPVLAGSRLLSLLLALRSPLLGPRISAPAITAVALALIAGVWWMYSLRSPTPDTTVSIDKAAQKQAEAAYAQFHAAMSTPAPQAQLTEFAQVTEQVYGLTGWQPTAIRYDGRQYHLQLLRQGGSVQWLTDWANQHHYALSIGAKGVEVTVPSQLSGRPQSAPLYSFEPFVASLIDQLDRLFPDQAISIGDAQMLGQTQSRALTINLTDVSPDVLILVGNALGERLPLSLTAMNVNVRAGLLSGNIQLSAWGI